MPPLQNHVVTGSASGIGRFDPDAAMARGLAGLSALADLIPASGYVHGDRPTAIDAGIYGFIANIHFCNTMRHCRAIHAAIWRRGGK